MSRAPGGGNGFPAGGGHNAAGHAPLKELTGQFSAERGQRSGTNLSSPNAVQCFDALCPTL